MTADDLISDEVLQQVSDQCRVVAALATSLAELHTDLSKVFSRGGAGASSIADVVGFRSANLMEMLGDILNGMDAAEDADWMTPIFREAQRRWPQ